MMNFAVLLVLISATLPNIGQNMDLQGVVRWLQENILKPVMDGISYICTAVVDLIRAPLLALVNIWNNWWISVLGFGWYSPLIGTLVVMLVFIMFAVMWKAREFIS